MMTQSSQHNPITSFTLPKYYQIVDEAKWLERFLPLGLELVQLRIKDKPQSYVKDQIREAKALCDEFGCQLIINDYWKLAIDQGCDYIHLGQEDLEVAELNVIKREGLKLGISTHDSTELQTAFDAEPNYIALGPVFHTILKAMKWRPQGVERVTKWKERVGDIPLIAIGGMKPERAKDVYSAGADSVCVVTDVLLHESPEGRLQEWLDIARSV